MLLENPQLSLIVLKPLIFENPEACYEGVCLSDAQEIYLNLCSHIARIETDGLHERFAARCPIHDADDIQGIILNLMLCFSDNLHQPPPLD
jgi:hypothetical protein